jgi:hypothetical protein
LSDPKLWKLIETWPLPFREEKDHASPPRRTCTRFEHNLRKIGDWTDEASVRITEAYRRYLYLKALNGGPITPPKCIDEAWHLHLEFPQNFTSLEELAGGSIPHVTDLSAIVRRNAYDEGRSLWLREFDTEPPIDIWPSRELIQANRRTGVWAALGISVVIFGIAALDTPIGFGFLATFVLVVGACLVVFPLIRTSDLSPETISRCG